MESDNQLSFFNKLKLFCKTLDGEITQMQIACDNCSKKNPQNYYRGLNTLRDEVQACKELSCNAAGKLSQFEEFSKFMEYSQEELYKHEQQLNKIEEYLQRYGFQPLAKSTTNSEVTICEDSSKEVVKKSLISPPLSQATLDVLHQMTLHKCTSEADMTAVSEDSHMTSPLMVQHSSLTSLSTPVVDSWWHNIDAKSAITPDILVSKPRWSHKVVDGRLNFFNKEESVKKDSILSRARLCEKKNTPEEPALNFPLADKKQPCSDNTPESPMLATSAVSSILQPYGSHCNASAKKVTPQEPLLKISFSEKITSPRSVVHSTPVLPSAYKENVPSNQKKGMGHTVKISIVPPPSDEVPPSPELSEFTMQFLRKVR